MSRQLLCPDCAQRYLPDGCRQVLARSPYGEPAEYVRVVSGTARRPTLEQRVMYVNEQAFPLDRDSYDCDDCNRAIHPGDPAVAVSVWVEGRPEPPAWESAFLLERT